MCRKQNMGANKTLKPNLLIQSYFSCTNPVFLNLVPEKSQSSKYVSNGGGVDVTFRGLFGSIASIGPAMDVREPGNPDVLPS